MKKIILIIAAITFSFNGYSQIEFKPKSNSIPAKNSKYKKAVPPKVEPPKVIPPVEVKKPDTLQINPSELFIDTNLYKKETNSEGVYYRKNQYLGSFKTNSLISKIRYRDAAFVDGDKIKVYLNGNIILPEVLLDSDFMGFEVKLEKGINRIDFEALNEGFAAPNTASFEVHDDKGTLINADQWNVGTGYKATIILIKE